MFLIAYVGSQNITKLQNIEHNVKLQDQWRTCYPVNYQNNTDNGSCEKNFLPSLLTNSNSIQYILGV